MSLNLKTKFILLIGFMFASFTIAGLIGYRAFNQVLVGGPVYKEIVTNKDLVADILPPPAYLVESWQVALEMIALEDEPLEPLIEKSKKLEDEFLARSEYWDKTITDATMLSIIQTKLIPSGKVFIRVRDSIFIPAIKSKDATAMKFALQQLKVAYNLHRNAVDELAALALARSTQVESEVGPAVNKANLTIIILALAALGLTVLGILIVVSKVVKQLGAEPEEICRMANTIAAGELNASIILPNNDNSSAMYSMKSMQDNIKLLVSEVTLLSESAVDGRLSVRADAAKHLGDYKKVIEGVNATLDAIVEPLNTAASYVDNLSKGIIPEQITASYKGDFNLIKNNLNACGDSIKALVADVGLLAKSTEAGDLALRANASKHLGDYRKVVQGLNASIDAMVSPLNMAASYVDSLSKGIIPPEITQSFNGDFNLIKNNLNACGKSIDALVSDANLIAKAADAGELSTRASTVNHLGEYRKVIEGLNATLDAVVRPLNMASINLDSIAQGNIPSLISDQFKGDFNAIKNNLNTCINAINALVSDTSMLSAAVREGLIETRADVTKHQGDFKKIIEGVNATLATIVEPIVTIKSAVETINTAAGEISSGNNDLSNRTEQQASTLQQTAASMQEMAATVKQNAENAKQANTLALTASNVAVKGGEVVAEVVSTMTAINTSAKKIESIISVIDNIAFQTNILALNAAVEAARAGEQGRGFAVVAGEVRNLAQRSASAAKEIKGLINDSVTKTAEGTSQVENAGNTMQEVVTSVKHVADIISEIAAASVEQSQGITQVNNAVTSMDEATQQNAALVEEAAAAALSLVDQANALSSAVSAFKIQGNNYAQKRVTHGTVIKSTGRTITSKSMAFGSKSAMIDRDNDASNWEEF